MVQHEQLFHTFVADAVLAGQDQRMGEELLADWADQLPLYVLDRDLMMAKGYLNKLDLFFNILEAFSDSASAVRYTEQDKNNLETKKVNRKTEIASQLRRIQLSLIPRQLL